MVLGALTPARPWFSKGRFAREMEVLVGEFRNALEVGRDEEADALLGEMEELTRGTEAPLDRLERMVHPWSSDMILPLFALANAGVALSGQLVREAAASPVTWGVLMGLLLEKPIGAAGLAWTVVRLRLARLPQDVGWTHLTGMGLLAGIGFTVSVFITGLAFETAEHLDQAKVGILAASALAGLGGYLFLQRAAGAGR